MRAKQFFYVCAGILMLVIAYQVMAPTARSNTTPLASSCSPEGFVDEEGQLYGATGDPWPPPTTFVPTGRIQTTAKIVALRKINLLNNGGTFAVAENGDILRPGPNGPFRNDWRVEANIFGANRPPGDRIVDVNSENSSGACAITAQGNAYDTGDIFNWRYLGNIFGGTVQVEGTSITDVKTKFREED